MKDTPIIKPADAMEGGDCTELQEVSDLWFRTNQGHTIVPGYEKAPPLQICVAASG